jgi:rSAM/selenodomain-associated transferase 2
MNLSVIIPTVNEAERIVTLVNYLLAHGNNFVTEIIISDAIHSTDNTLEKVEGINKVHGLKASATSRAVQMNEAARYASNDLLYFVHADVFPPSSYSRDIAEHIDKGYDFGIFSYIFNSDSPLLKINAYTTRFDGLFSGGGDQTLFIKKGIFQTMNGFREDLVIMEDFDLYWRLKKAGYRRAIVKNNVLVSDRKYRSNNYIKVNLVNLVTFLLFRLGYSPIKLKAFYQRALSTK